MKEKNQTVSIIGDKLKLDVTGKRHRGGSLCKGRNSRKIRREKSVRSVSRKDTAQRHAKNQSGLYPGKTQHKDTPRTSQVCIQERHSTKTQQEPVRSVSWKDTAQRHAKKNQSGLYPGKTQHKDTPTRTSQVCIQERHSTKTHQEPVRSVSRNDTPRKHAKRNRSALCPWEFVTVIHARTCFAYLLS